MAFLDRFRGKAGYEAQRATRLPSERELKAAELEGLYGAEEERRGRQALADIMREERKGQIQSRSKRLSEFDVVGGSSQAFSGLSPSKGRSGIELVNERKKAERQRLSMAVEEIQARDRSELAEKRFAAQERLRLAESEKLYDVEKDLEKSRRMGAEKFELEKIRAQLKREEVFRKEYGPAFNVPVIGNALGRVSQYRNYQQIQDIRRAKIETARQLQLAQLQRAQQSRQMLTPAASGGFGQPLSMGGGFGMGMGMNFGPSRESGYGGGLGMDSQTRDPLALPIIAGLGGGFGQRQEEQAQQPQFVPQPRVSYAPEYPPYASRPANALQSIPKARPVGYVSSKNPGVIQYAYEDIPGSIYRKTMQVYGASYKKISPEEAIPGEKLYKRVRTPYGHKHILIK